MRVEIGAKPKVLVKILCQKGIEKVQLRENESFACEIEGFNHLNREPLEQALEWLRAYAKGVLLETPFLSWKEGTAFTHEVSQELCRIPFGTMTTYKAIAINVGHPHAYRAVGSCCRKNPFPLFVPCHRVISSKSGLTGFAFGLSLKKELLTHESSFFPRGE